MDDLKKVIMSTEWTLFNQDEQTFLEAKLPLLERLIGACADMKAATIFSLAGSSPLTIEDLLSSLLNNPSWKSWLDKQFPEKLPDLKTLVKLWDRAKEISSTIYPNETVCLHSASAKSMTTSVSATINHRRFIATFPNPSNGSKGYLDVVDRIYTPRSITDSEIAIFATQIKQDLNPDQLKAVTPLLIALEPKFAPLLFVPTGTAKWENGEDSLNQPFPPLGHPPEKSQS